MKKKKWLFLFKFLSLIFQIMLFLYFNHIFLQNIIEEIKIYYEVELKNKSFLLHLKKSNFNRLSIIFTIEAF